jgi:hypothetical protein
MERIALVVRIIQRELGSRHVDVSCHELYMHLIMENVRMQIITGVQDTNEETKVGKKRGR